MALIASWSASYFFDSASDIIVVNSLLFFCNSSSINISEGVFVSGGDVNVVVVVPKDVEGVMVPTGVTVVAPLGVSGTFVGVSYLYFCSNWICSPNKYIFWIRIYVFLSLKV